MVFDRGASLHPELSEDLALWMGSSTTACDVVVPVRSRYALTLTTALTTSLITRSPVHAAVTEAAFFAPTTAVAFSLISILVTVGFAPHVGGDIAFGLTGITPRT